MRPDIACVSSAANDLGESPYWDSAKRRLYWIDAWRSQVHELDPATGETRCMELGIALGGLPIGSIGRHSAGGMIAGIKGGFWHLDPERGSARRIAAVEADRPATNRLNDGKCDRAGRFWCASVNTDHRSPTGALWRLAGSDPVLMQDGLAIGNGIAFSPDDRTMYLADTLTRRVWRYDFDLATGALANRRLFISTDHIAGFVDGATVDADGCYWAALFRGSAVAQFDPDGRLARHVRLPVANPTMCVFGGPDLDILYVTSASRFLDEAAQRAQPLAGHLFAIEGLGVRGIAEPEFKP
ncbi:MAG: SMP-30/gluconolactonase/LRE family protein [Reyranella sp.]|nr:SMP-30/gluconolactonase/LRE family protein [Reyranella sp.]